MSTASKADKPWTVEEFLNWHARQEGRRFELVDGYPVEKFKYAGPDAKMMTGASLAHNRISANIARRLGNKLEGGGCSVFAHDAAVRTAIDQIRYPDIVVDCGTPADLRYELEDARVIIEVLSPTTKNLDLTRKLEEYWSIATVRHILLVDSQAMRAQLISRADDGARSSTILEKSDDAIALTAINATLTLDDVYQGVAFSEDENPRP